ncbi:MAG TPA: FAD-dependent monooxygenase [Actinocrinis sp.]|nr:FAD-dependent monooxygenase [Actinocrinis sp.]
MLSEGSTPDGELDAEVLIVGAGPVGCWLAAELCGAGVRVLVIEARGTRAQWSRGFVVHPRTLEILHSRGAAEPLLEAGQRLPTWHFAMGSRRLDFTALPTAFPFLLLQPQARTEELLEAHLTGLGGAVLRGRRAVGLTQFKDRVVVRVAHEGTEHELTAAFVVGCDGARSAVRQAAGIEFTGTPDTLVSPSALVELADPPPPDQYMQTREQGIFFTIALPDGRFVVSTIDHARMAEVDIPWTADMVRESVRRITGTDFGMGEPERVSTIGNSAKQAHRYRDHRVLLAGDAAHVHFPMGGQGLNLGIQDAHNLAWRLAAAALAQRADPRSPLVDALLDGYEAERRPAGEHVLEDVRAQMALVAAPGADGAALRSRFDALLHEHPEVNLEYAGRLSGLNVRYPAPAGDDQRLGSRAPDLLLDLGGPDGQPTGLYELMRSVGPARFLYLDLRGGPAQPGEAEADADSTAKAQLQGLNPGFGSDVVTIAARAVLGPDWAVQQGWGAAEAVLIRPDGHVASTGAEDDAALGALASYYGIAVAP